MIFISFFWLIACFAALRSVITVELLGLERLTSAFGLLLLFQGIAVTIGSPIAGIYQTVPKIIFSVIYKYFQNFSSN